MHFQNIHAFSNQKTLLNTFLLLVFKIVESLQCTHKKIVLKPLAKFTGKHHLKRDSIVEIFENSFIADQLQTNVSTLDQTVPESLFLFCF